MNYLTDVGMKKGYFCKLFRNQPTQSDTSHTEEKKEDQQSKALGTLSLDGERIHGVSMFAHVTSWNIMCVKIIPYNY